MWSSVFLTDPRQTLEASLVPLNAEGFRGNNQCKAHQNSLLHFAPRNKIYKILS